MPTKHQIFRSSMVVGFFSLVGSLAGILVETSIAAKLGLSRSSDTFYAAFTLPYIITTLISATGQFSLVPFFAALEARHSNAQLGRGFSYAVNLVFLALGGIAALGIAAAPWVMHGIAPGFTHAQIELATQLSQFLFVMIIPAGVAEVFRSFLLSKHRFALPSASGFLRNATVIVVILIGFRRFGPYSIVLGYLAGYFLQLLVLGLQIQISFRVSYSPTLGAGGEVFRNLRGAGSAQLAGAAGWQGVVIVERIIASFLPAGTLTALNFGFKIMSTLSELLAGSVGTAALPALSRASAGQQRAMAWNTFKTMMEISLALVSPMMVLCLMLDRNIIRLVYQRGSFTPEATVLTALVFFYYSLSLLPFSFIRLLTFYFFGRNEPWVYVRLALFQYGLTIGIDLLYVGVFKMGAKGIPLGLLTGLVVASVLAVHRDLGNLRPALDQSLGRFAVKTLTGCVLAALTVWGLQTWQTAPQTGFENFLLLCELCGAGGLVFVASLMAMRVFRLSHLAEIWTRAGEPQ